MEFCSELRILFWQLKILAVQAFSKAIYPTQIGFSKNLSRQILQYNGDSLLAFMIEIVCPNILKSSHSLFHKILIYCCVYRSGACQFPRKKH